MKIEEPARPRAATSSTLSDLRPSLLREASSTRGREARLGMIVTVG